MSAPCCSRWLLQFLRTGFLVVEPPANGTFLPVGAEKGRQVPRFLPRIASRGVAEIHLQTPP
jgi:hypothetical protein